MEETLESRLNRCFVYFYSQWDIRGELLWYRVSWRYGTESVRV